MKEMKKAKKEMKDIPSAPKKKLQKLQKKMQQQEMSKKMRQNSQQLRKNQLQKARQQQQRIQKRLQNMRSRLSQMKQQMKGQQRQMNITGLRSALENTLRLSEDQEDLRTAIEKLDGDEPTVRRYAVKQKDLTDGLKTLADSLQSIASRLPKMSQAVQKKTGNALRAMEKSTTSLDDREAKQATGYQKTSMMHLNELALLLSKLLNQMQQQPSGGSGKMSMQQAMQQLQKASGQQQKLNKQIQKFLNKAQGQRLSKDGQARRKQLAKQQRRIKQQLEEMNVQEETKQKLMGDLQKIAKEMEKSADDLQGGRHSRDLIKRQQQILTRLLNAQQSLRTQGKKQQRRGRRADENIDRKPPGERPDQDEVDALRRDLIRALEMGYNSDYEELIKQYFELLQQSEENGK
jgi:DNA repair ATPase RecN